MIPLAITLTDVGLARLVAAGGTNAVVISKLALTATGFVSARTLTALPGEFKRLDNVSGAAIDATTIHMTARDFGADAYTVRGFGLFLADGTLFGTYSQAAPIFEKAGVSTFLLAFDIKFAPGQVPQIQFGDANFLYPPASDAAKGVVEIATQAETDAGTDADRVVTPRTLGARIAAIVQTLSASIAARALGIRTIVGTGLAVGGGDLTADRTIDVPVASAAEADFGVSSTKALVPASLANILARIGAQVPSVRKITAQGLAFGGGDLTSDVIINVPLASILEVNAYSTSAKAVTPFSLKHVVQAVNAAAISSRRVDTSGLALGGGDLTADRTIDVPKASAADVAAGTSDAKAVTPLALAALAGTISQNGYCKLFGGLIIQWGRFTSNANGSTSVSFPIVFPNACFSVVQDGGSNLGVDSKDNAAVLQANSISASGFTVFSADDSANGCAFIAIGN